MPRRRLAAAAAAAATGLVALATGVTFSAFTSATANGASSIAAAPDFRAPTVSAATIAKTTGYDPAFVKQAGTYYVYANVTDTGNPASGVASVTANVSALTPGQTAAPLAAGSFSAGGVAYNRRSAALTVRNPLAAGGLTCAIITTDAAANTQTTSGLGVTVDNTAPAAADVQTANLGSLVTTAQLGDTITFTTGEPLDPQSILAGWTGASTNVVVRLNNAASDTLQVFNPANTAQLPLGTVSLGSNAYVTANRTFGLTGTPSTMVRSGNSIAVTLGTASGAVSTAPADGTMTWTPATAAYDRAGNAMSATAKTETGAADREF
jgi:hypothetical protein